MQLSIDTDFPQIQRQLAGLRRDIAGQALPRALNRTMDQAKTAMSREIRSEFNMTAAKVNESLRVRRATFFAGELRLEASLESPTKRGRSLNLINFAARKTSRGLTVKIKKAGARKVVRGAFIANKGRTVFQRVGRARLPIKAVQTIDVAQMFNTRRINEKVVRAIIAIFPRLLDHEIKFYTDRFNRGGA